MKINLLGKPLVLASGSLQRAALLREYGFSFRVFPANTEECFLFDESPEKNAIRLAGEKARVVFALFPEEIVLAADTIVVSGKGKMFGKAASREEAREMMEERKHGPDQVVTGWMILSPYGQQKGCSRSWVHYRPLPPADQEMILDSGEWKDVAGALRIEGEQMQKMIARYTGDYANILGLPVGTIAETLRSFPLSQHKKGPVSKKDFL